jgi:hypothetical protein
VGKERHPYGRERKLLLFSDEIIFNIENSNKSIKKKKDKNL